MAALNNWSWSKYHARNPRSARYSSVYTRRVSTRLIGRFARVYSKTSGQFPCLSRPEVSLRELSKRSVRGSQPFRRIRQSMDEEQRELMPTMLLSPPTLWHKNLTTSALTRLPRYLSAHVLPGLHFSV